MSFGVHNYVDRALYLCVLNTALMQKPPFGLQAVGLSDLFDLLQDKKSDFPLNSALP